MTLTAEQIDQYCDEAAELGRHYEALKSKEPYHINIIDELHANENAHTRILIRLLAYKQAGTYPFLESFMTLLRGWTEAGLEIGNPKIDSNTEYIDGLIESPRRYAVIIENKIHWAVDQERQIEKYVMGVRNHGIPSDRIWVVYLTSDGNKTVERYSYTEKAKEIVQDRFIPLNYRSDILPWLKETVLPNCVVKEEWLISALKQYIDHLEGFLGLRTNQKQIQKEMEKYILQKAGISGNADPAARYAAFKTMEERFTSLLQLASNGRASIEAGLMASFTEQSTRFFESNYPDRAFDFNDKTSLGYYQIRPANWPQGVHFEWIPLRGEQLVEGKDLTIVLHIEPSRANSLSGLIAGLDADADFEEVPGRAEGLSSKSPSTYLSITKQFGRSFIHQSDRERQECLSSFYNEICQAIPIIDHYLFP